MIRSRRNLLLKSSSGVGNGTSLAGCGPVSATFTSTGCYDITLTVTDINGCSGTLTANNLICMEDAPDVSFNPSTGVASGFDPYDYNLFIYNRWGELIFESKDANFGWDGTYGIGGENRAVQDGTYTYQIIYKLKNNDFRSTIHGHVNVIR